MATLKKQTEVKRLYPSEFGSSSSMIDDEETAKLSIQTRAAYVVCKDQFGLYTTEIWRLDNNLLDVNRCANSRIKLG